MEKFDLTSQKAVETVVDDAIKADLGNAKSVARAVAIALLHAAGEAGRFEPFNRLFNGVSVGTMGAIRLYMGNLTKLTGIETVNENGQKIFVRFFNYSQSKGFFHPPVKTDEMKAHRAKIAEMSVEKLCEIPLGAMSAQNERRQMEYDLTAFEDKISKAIKFGLTNDIISTASAEQFNKLLSASMRVDPKVLVEEKQKREAEFDALAAKRGYVRIQDNKPETTPGKVEKTGNDETQSKAA